MSQITTHVLDTSLGKPAQGISIILEEKSNDGWNALGSGTTNSDGRISDLLPKEKKVSVGTYRLVFKVKPYFDEMKIKSFYPEITIEFEITSDTHYHVPLLLNPFGFSTYRGS